MCGIAGFLSNGRWRTETDTGWLAPVLAGLTTAATPDGAIDRAGLERTLDALADRFDDLMAFAVHAGALADAGLRGALDRTAAAMAGAAAALRPEAGDAAGERLAERLRDHAWQLSHEVVGNLDRSAALLPAGLAADRAQHFVAWAVGQVIENLDRLEVRGRDSAGLSLQLLLEPPAAPGWLAGLRRRLADSGRLGGDGPGRVALHPTSDNRVVARFTYKTAQLIGRLGDNSADLRASIRGDALLWDLAEHVAAVSALAHTRWASHGAINLYNCHPLNGALDGEDPAGLTPDADLAAVANGDVDNYRALAAGVEERLGGRLPGHTTTDSKVIPTAFRAEGGAGGGNAPVAERALAVLNRLEGSIATVMQHAGEPDRLYLGQKGSGQSLFIAETHDGLIIASENYGLAPRARRSVALSEASPGGLAVTLSVRAGDPALLARSAATGETVALKADPIQIFSRDIFRGRFDHFFEKEVHEAPASVRKTLAGRYRRDGRLVDFTMSGTGPWHGLRHRLTDPNRPALRRIWVTGQGTAAIAALGVAHLLRRALGDSPILVEAVKASELSADLEGRDLSDALVIAISQSGTTTDTNRTVDLARAAGAWIHAIVNRRNSDLVRKADSHLFTSDGRDIEMAVASTKAFYSQVAAGKLVALCIADTLGTLDPARIHDELGALEGLPARIQEVLDAEDAIAACARRHAPVNRYWACVGNGPNRIAAEEIRIKLSELCYKSIPVDFTEDKKHIDLSTEPLTIVIANDMPGALAQDTAKEVAIFKAHNGKPIVFAAKGEACFDAYAEEVVRLPSAGAGLDFVLATVAGHLWGFHAARAIDESSTGFKALYSRLDELAAAPGNLEGFARVAGDLETMVNRIAAGGLDAALPPRLAAGLALLTARLATADRLEPAGRQALAEEAARLLHAAFEETSRPIDTIRHQAKTVTVGISRPGRDVHAGVQALLAELGVSMAGVAEHDRRLLVALSPVLGGANGGLWYRITRNGADGAHTMQVAARAGSSKGRPSGYDQPRVAAGSKRRAMRLGRALLSSGRQGTETLVLVPTFSGPDWVLTGLVLLHLDMVGQVSLQQKTTLLKELHLYEDLFDAFQEAAVTAGRQPDASAPDFTAFLEGRTPRDLLFDPALMPVRPGLQAGG